MMVFDANDRSSRLVDLGRKLKDFDDKTGRFNKKFMGAVAIGSKVVLAPYKVDTIVVFDVTTDNFNVTGESFDYGPWRFLPHFDPNLTAAYFDQTGRYAYGRQSDAALWAVCRLADCFVKIVPQKDLEDQLRSFHSLVEARLAKQIQWRLGIFFDIDDASRDAALTRDFFGAAKASQYGFDQIFHDLYGGQPRIEGYDANHWKPVLNLLQDASPRNIAALDHPHFQAQKALSMTIDEVEAIWDPIAANDDWSLLSAKLAAIHQMRQAYGVGDVPLPRVVGGPAS